MAKTYLQLLNEVGKKLRRSTGSTYTTITQDQNAVFMGSMLNQAKRLVEDRWKWHQLRYDVTFSSVGGTASYDTSSLSVVTSDPTVTNDRTTLLYDRFRRPQFWDVTTSGSGYMLMEVSREYAEDIRNTQTSDVEIPNTVSVFQNGSGLTCLFPFAPSGVRNYRFKAYIPQDELADGSTNVLAPWRPIVLAATALCCEERGEEFGMPGSRWWDEYEQAISAAVGGDSDDRDFTLVPD